MPREINRNLVVIALAVIAFAPVTLGLFRQPFEGTRWRVTVTPDDDARQAGAREFEDTLFFKGGKFVAESLAKRGFAPVEFKEEMAPGGLTATFTAEATSHKEGTARWRGTTTAGEMRGEMILIKDDGTELNHAFKGERLAK